MSNKIIHKFDEIFIIPLTKEKKDLLPLYIDNLRLILFNLLSPKSISRVVIAVENLIEAFQAFDKEIDRKIISKRVFCVDTSEILSGIYPTFNWYHCLKSIFSNPKSLMFFVPPWFIIETLKTIKNKVMRGPYARQEHNLLKDLLKNQDIIKYCKDFELDVGNKYIYMKNTEWDDAGIENNFFNTLNSISGKNKDSYTFLHFNKLLKTGIMKSARHLNYIKSFKDYGDFAKTVQDSNQKYIKFRSQLIEERKIYDHNLFMKPSKKLRLNASVDSIVIGFLNWILKKNQIPKNSLSLLSRDSLYQTVNKWSKDDKDCVFSYNPQTLFLIWSFVEQYPYADASELSALKNYCKNSVNNLKDIAYSLVAILRRGKSHKLELIEKIFYWFKDQTKLNLLQGNITNAAKFVLKWSGETKQAHIHEIIESIKNQGNKVDENVSDYFRLSEEIINIVEKLEEKSGKTIIPICDGISSWATKVKESTSDITKLKKLYADDK
ncbi:MAG: hypothetical protein KAT34_02265 [Candidatus Aminicenantes bacterium]|nr:hypothetical protein [Candidatus Aminicenantes bacterium]